jgi:hypothetical protein
MMMASGRLQLSYCAVSTSTTSTTDRNSTAAQRRDLDVQARQRIERVSRS